MNNSSRLILKKGKEKALERKHPWIFSGAIDMIDDVVQNGDWVQVLSHKNECIGYGHFSEGSAIAVRMLAFNSQANEKELIQNRLQAAYNLRLQTKVINPNNSIFRLVHGEGDFLPGLVIDCYQGMAVLQCHSYGMFRIREHICDCLKQVVPNLIGVYCKSKESLHDPSIENHHLWGDLESQVATENDLQYHIDWVNGQKTGFFIDQRENRALLRDYAENKIVLNTFCYSGGFSLSALKGHAKSVTSVDSSAHAIDLLQENLALNAFDGQHNSVVSDTLDYLKTADLSQVDIVVLDPPAYSKNKNTRHKAVQAYKRLNSSCLKKMKPGALLFTFSCSQVVGKELFYNTVVSAALESRRNVKVLHHLNQSACHPVNLNHPEGEYLKGLVLQVE